MTVAETPTASLNKFEKFKAEKDGLAVKGELDHFAEIGWEAMDATDREHRLKWLGIFFRPVTPGKFMMRMRIPSGILNAVQMRVLAEIIQRYGGEGYADITTRQNLQLRGIRIEDVPDIFNKLRSAGITSIQSGMDNVRNITGSPVADLDADELIDTRDLVQKVQDMITNCGEGNPEFSNLPRKFNIAIEGGRDNSVHAEINDVAFVPAYNNGQLGFNVVVGGFFSAKRCEAAIPLNAWVPANDDVVDLCRAILIVFRDQGPRSNRQKSRLMWLIDEMGLEHFRAAVEKQFGRELPTAALKDEIDWEKRDHLGIFAQKQPGLNFAGLHVPVGRLFAPEMFDIARVAEVYGNGEIRLTVEQNILIPNIPDSRLEAFLSEPILQKFSINPAPLTRALVSCTGAQFCNFALIETKNRAMEMIAELEQEVSLSRPVRIHWTGCPNSCGQPQVADIGLMGTKARKNGKAVEGVDIYMGGKVGKDAHLGTCVTKGVPCEDLKPVLRHLLIENFGAQLKGEILEAPATLAQPSDTAQTNGTKATSNGHHAQPAVLVLAKSGKELACDSSELILDVAEREGIELPSSCRSGSCGTCKQILLEGEVKYDANPEALDDSERTQGVILACSAHPVGRVVIDA
ncbi:ferredoxin--nitrite reductase [Microcoleus sp. FACHB-68]|nr:ferredoxin--nitrite reductase [Microcoleus sp. FACHB-68]MBD1937007.1 ferredoxin--nitrite reductase [Microcoleus sp. FACHB-68]